MIRVLHISQGKLYGGVERLLVTLARYHQVCPEMHSEFAFAFAGRCAAELAAAGARVHHLGAARIRNPWSILRARGRLAAVLGDGGFDAAICHLAWAQAVFGPAATGAGVPELFWLHGATDGRHWLERWARIAPPDLAIASSQFAATMLPAIYPAVESAVVRCPVAPPQCEAPGRWAIRRALCAPRDAVVIAQVGRLEPGKGHALHLEALARLREMPEWICWMIGGAQSSRERRYLNSMRERVRALRLEDRIQFLGERNDVAALLSGADIYCQPAIRPEGFGISYVEALYASLPIVATDLGGPREIVDDSCGLLVAPGDPAELAQALRRLVANRALRDRLGANGPARAATLCSPAAQLRRLEQVITGRLRIHDGSTNRASMPAA